MFNRFLKKEVSLIIAIVLILSVLVVSLPAFAFRQTPAGRSLKAKKSLHQAKPQTTFGKIDDARKSGKISYEDSLILKAQIFFNPKKLPQEYKVKSKPIKDGTMLLLQLKSELKAIKNRSFKSKLKRMIGSGSVDTIYGKGALNADILADDLGEETPVLQALNETYETANFRFHYTNSGADAVPSAGYVQTFGDIFENVWSKEVDGDANSLHYLDTVGFNSDLPGADTKYNVYIRDCGGDYPPLYGYAAPMDTAPAPSYMVVDNDYSPGQFGGNAVDNQSVTAAHEFFHAIQFAYNIFDSDYVGDGRGPNSWWMEATAVWMEEQVYPDVNDYLNYVYGSGIEGWFAYPEESLNTFDGGQEYGSVMFIKYLEQKAGGGAAGQQLIKNIWNSLINYNFSTSGNSIAKKIESVSGWSFNSAYSDFMAQNYIINPSKSSVLWTHYTSTDANDLMERHDSAWGSSEPYIWVHKTKTLPFSATESSGDLPQYLGTNFNVVNAPSTPQTVAFSFTGGTDVYSSATASWSVKLLMRKKDGGSYVINNLVSPGGSSGTRSIGKFGTGTGGVYDRAVFVISVVNPPDSNLSKKFKYTYGARKISTVSTPAPKSSYVYGSSGVSFTSVISPSHAGKTDVRLEKSNNNSSWLIADPTMTWNSTKYVSDAQKPSLTTGTYYRARWLNGDSDHLGSTSASKLLPVVAFSSNKTKVAKNNYVTLSGTVYPTSLKGKYVTLQWRKSTSSSWTSKSLKLNSYSKYAYSYWKSSYAGTYYFRVLLPAQTSPSTVASYSATKTITVN